jgi:hypothetical protein
MKTKYFELINKAVDGTLSPQEKEQLDAYLADDENAEKLFRDLLFIGNQLDTIGKEDPSPSLKNNIMAHLPLQRPVSKSPSYSIWKSFGELFHSKPQLKIGYAFFAGLIAGVIVFSIFTGITGNSVDVQSLSGTIVPTEYLESLPEGVVESFASDRTTGEIVFRYGKGVLVGELSIQSGENIEVNLTIPSEHILLTSVSSDVPGTLFIESIEGKISIKHAGIGTYLLLFKDVGQFDGNIKMQILSKGVLISDHDLLLRR